jgi:hypothetical protein
MRLDVTRQGCLDFIPVIRQPEAGMINWKQHLIALTEQESARALKLDVSFFPPVREEGLLAWEATHAAVIPGELRGFLAESDGLEVGIGTRWVVRPLAEWDVREDLCSSRHRWVCFGDDATHRYLFPLAEQASIYQEERYGADEHFFAATFRRYLELVFRGV